MTPLALKLIEDREGQSVKELAVFLAKITEEIQEIEKELSIKLNDEIIQLFYEKDQQIRDFQSFIQTLDQG